jgi:hypothetical protein
MIRDERPDPEEHAKEDQRTGGLISLRMALALYFLLAAAAIFLLKGKALALALIIVGGIAAKTLTGYAKDRQGP